MVILIIALLSQINIIAPTAVVLGTTAVVTDSPAP